MTRRTTKTGNSVGIKREKEAVIEQGKLVISLLVVHGYLSRLNREFVCFRKCQILYQVAAQCICRHIMEHSYLSSHYYLFDSQV